VVGTGSGSSALVSAHQRIIGVPQGPDRTVAIMSMLTTGPDVAIDDQTLLAALQARDEAAMRLVLRAHGAAIVASARRAVGDEGLAEDAAQDAVTMLWQRPERVDLTRGSLRAFLGIIAGRRAIDLARGEAARRRRQEVAHAARTDEPAVETVVVESTEREHRAARARAAVAALPPRQREVIELAWFEGHTYRGVAEVLAIPEGTAKSRLRDGMQRLAASLADLAPDNLADLAADEPVLVSSGRRSS
jgi:RNA polymerase sigma-70 factor (ECF subfamily)